MSTLDANNTRFDPNGSYMRLKKLERELISRLDKGKMGVHTATKDTGARVDNMPRGNEDGGRVRQRTLNAGAAARPLSYPVPNGLPPIAGTVVGLGLLIVGVIFATAATDYYYKEDTTSLLCQYIRAMSLTGAICMEPEVAATNKFFVYIAKLVTRWYFAGKDEQNVYLKILDFFKDVDATRCKTLDGIEQVASNRLHWDVLTIRLLRRPCI